MKRGLERSSMIARPLRALLAMAIAAFAAGAPPVLAQPPADGGEAPRATDFVPAAEGIPSLVVNSEPPGAVVILRGAYEWVGVTPWRLTRPLSGLYRVEARRPGYETWRSEVVLGASFGQELNITLGQKTLGKALLRSVILPGWGQMYRGSKGKGLLVLGGTILAGGAFAWTDAEYGDAVDEFDAARARYEQATRLEELDSRWNDVRRASSHADRKWEHRRLALGALTGLYAFNLLDVIFFSPSGEAETGGFSNRESPSGAPPALGWTASAAPDGSIQAALHWIW